VEIAVAWIHGPYLAKFPCVVPIGPNLSQKLHQCVVLHGNHFWWQVRQFSDTWATSVFVFVPLRSPNWHGWAMYDVALVFTAMARGNRNIEYAKATNKIASPR
jgi:hypothetical protein